MKNMKISTTLTVAFGSILILLTAIVIVAVINLNSVTNRLKDFYDVPFQNVQNIIEMKAQLNELAKNMLHTCVATDTSEKQERLNVIPSIVTDMKKSLSLLKQSYNGNKQDLINIEQSIQVVETKFESFKQSFSRNDIANAYKVYEQMRDEFEVIVTNITNIQTFEGNNALSTYQNGKNAGQFTILFTIIIGLISIVLGVSMAIYIIRVLVTCVTELKNSSLQISEGNFDAPLTYHSKDELGELSHGMRIMTANVKDIIEDTNYLLGEMADGNFEVTTKIENRYVGVFEGLLYSMRKLNINLSNTLGQINRSSDQVASSSEQVSSGAQALSQGATQQASSVEELAATISGISIQISNNAENAVEASHKMDGLGYNIQASNNQMNQMTQAMNQISKTSGEIGKIIKTIEDIAFQTNILALNAAVEAARAGMAGKGFAVVADEVRNLASKSAEAANNTTTLIESSLQAVEDGTKIADETAKSLVKVVDEARSVVETMDKISQVSKEQADSIIQVTQGIDQISSVVQTNSATAEQSAAASEELSGQAQMLKDLVNKFKIKNSSIKMKNLEQTTRINHDNFISPIETKY